MAPTTRPLVRSYFDECKVCGTKMTGFTTLFCPKEAEHEIAFRLPAGTYRAWPPGPHDMSGALIENTDEGIKVSYPEEEKPELGISIPPGAAAYWLLMSLPKLVFTH